MIYENWLYTGSLNIKTVYCDPLQDNLKTDCLVIGGGFAGLHAALRLINAGKKVVLIEKRFCGGSSSGQSGGFLTPESEEDLRQIIAKYGKEKGKLVYNIPRKGVKLIVDTINKHKFNCDLRKQDSLYFSTKTAHNKFIKEEAESKKDQKLPFIIYNKNTIKKIHPGKNYILGLKYPGSYGINSFAYCQEMKNLLLKKGVKIFEDSEVLKIDGNTAKTHLGSVTAKNIILCMDKLKSEIDEELSHNYYHLQTFLTISEPLSRQEMRSLFPRQELMCWDTDLIYIHYRPILGNRIILGGSSPMVTYYKKTYYSPKVIESFINKLKTSFPSIKDVKFTHFWAGMLDVTKDLMPIADYVPKNKSIQYSMGCAGLNWAAYCGDYLAQRIIDPKKTEDFTEFLGAQRKFFISKNLQKILGKRISFALSHLKKYFS